MSNSVAPPSLEEMRRLALVRHLFRLAVDQSRGPEPTAALSLMPFHDASESFLLLACERVGAGANKTDFMRYWELLLDKGVSMPHREVMRRVNAARVSLKHQGVLPAKVELEGFRSAVTNLLYDGVFLVFGIRFDQISLMDLIANEPIKIVLRAAFDAFERGDHGEALGSAAVGFTYVQRAYREKGLQLKRPSPRFGSMFEAAELRKISEDFRHIEHSISAIAEAVEVIGYGLDFQSYILFKSSSPFVHLFAGMDYSTETTVEWLEEPTKDADIVLRSINFVVEAAIQFRV